MGRYVQNHNDYFKVPRISARNIEKITPKNMLSLLNQTKCGWCLKDIYKNLPYEDRTANNKFIHCHLCNKWVHKQCYSIPLQKELGSIICYSCQKKEVVEEKKSYNFWCNFNAISLKLQKLYNYLF